MPKYYEFKIAGYYLYYCKEAVFSDLFIWTLNR